MPLVRAYIALGSNLGDRLGQMQAALDQLARDASLCVQDLSPIFENRAVGMGDADPFLNAVAEVATSLPPLELLDRCLEVETALGRTRSGHWAPRTIDLDIIAYGELRLEHERLRLPHPRIAERDFVLHPLNAIAPDLQVDDEFVAELAARVRMDALTLYPQELSVPQSPAS